MMLFVQFIILPTSAAAREADPSVIAGMGRCYAPTAKAVDMNGWANILVILDHNGLVHAAHLIDYGPANMAGESHARTAIRALHFCAPYSTRERKALLRIAPTAVEAGRHRIHALEGRGDAALAALTAIGGLVPLLAGGNFLV